MPEQSSISLIFLCNCFPNSLITALKILHDLLSDSIWNTSATSFWLWPYTAISSAWSSLSQILSWLVSQEYLHRTLMSCPYKTLFIWFFITFCLPSIYYFLIFPPIFLFPCLLIQVECKVSHSPLFFST